MKKSNVIVLIALSFILGSTVSLFFISFDQGASNKESSFSRFGHSISYANGTNRYHLLILIVSNPSNLSKRNTIRETWLQFVKGDRSVKHLFVLGTLGLSIEKEQMITVEYSKYGDILSLNTIFDTYNTLTKKLLTSFVFVEKQYNFKFLLKCDDDTFVQASDLVKELKSNNFDKERLYWGYFNGKARVYRTGKWKENSWFLCDNYLPYALGGGYVLSQLLVRFISQNAEYLSLYNSEDISVGVWLSPLNISRVHDTRFDTEYVSRGCFNTYLVTHKKSEKDMRHLYSEMVTHGRMCPEEFQNRHSYIYNWSVPPSRCCKNHSIIH